MPAADRAIHGRTQISRHAFSYPKTGRELHVAEIRHRWMVNSRRGVQTIGDEFPATS